MSENREEFNKNLEEYKQMTQSSIPELGMKWFKYLIYFQLFFGAAEYLLQAVFMIFNFQNPFIQELFSLYYFEGDMRPVGVILGILWLMPAAMNLYARFELAAFKKGAPKKYLIIVVATEVLTFANNLFVTLYKYMFFDKTEIVIKVVMFILSAVIGSLIYIYPNYIYFKKRKHLFVN